jgi:hypothetical protein
MARAWDTLRGKLFEWTRGEFSLSINRKWIDVSLEIGNRGCSSVCVGKWAEVVKSLKQISAVILQSCVRYKFSRRWLWRLLFWDVTSGSLSDSYQSFVGTWCLCLQDIRFFPRVNVPIIFIITTRHLIKEDEICGTWELFAKFTPKTWKKITTWNIKA